MTSLLITSTIYATLFLISSNFDATQAIVGGIICGGASTIVLKLFDKNKNK